MSRTEAATQEVATLEGLGLDDLRAIWRERYGAPPTLRSPELVAMILAWRLQAQCEGGIDADMRRALRRTSAGRGQPTPNDGTRLTREWKGVRHEVTTLGDGGFVYSGVRYQSLSQIARLITGSRWNGPRFFGLRAEDVGN